MEIRSTVCELGNGVLAVTAVAMYHAREPFDYEHEHRPRWQTEQEYDGSLWSRRSDHTIDVDHATVWCSTLWIRAIERCFPKMVR
jgi:hypothetical protein